MGETATSPAAETRTERHLRQLALLADRAVELACHLQEAALGAPDLQEKSRLARDFYFADRAARQSILTEARLARQSERDARETEKHDATKTAEAVAIRKARVQAGVERLIWTQLDGPEAESWTADLSEQLDDDALEPGFADEDLDAHIERLADDLGLTGEHRHDYVPRTLRRSHTYRTRPTTNWRPLLEGMTFDEEEDEAEAPTETAAEPPAPPSPASEPQPYEPDFGPPPDDEPPPEPPPQANPPLPPPDPPPRPYVPPWEQIPRGSRFPSGGSGW